MLRGAVVVYGILIATLTAGGNAVDFENGVSIRIKGTAQLQCGNDVSQAVVFNIEGLTSTGKTIFDGLCDFIGDNTLLSTQEHEDTAELISNGEEADVEVACADEPSISSHCAMDSVRCDDGQPTCAADGCKDGFINRKPASECVGVDGCTFQTRRVAMSEDAQWIVQAVAPIGIQTKISANQTLREKLVARLFRLDEMVGSWILAQDVLVPDNSSTDDNYDMDKAFGVSVAICRTSQDPDGKLRVLVGDTSAGLFGKQSAGEARVFTYHTLTGVLGLEQILQPQTHSEFDYFGTSVALSSDCTTAMIGAPGVSSYRGSAMIYDLDRSVEDGAPNYEGGVPVYIPSSVVQPLSLDGSVVETPNHFFGQAIATNHDASVVFMGGYSAGVVYVYREYTKDSYRLAQRIEYPLAAGSADAAVNSTKTSNLDTGAAQNGSVLGYGTTLACSCAGDVLVVGSPLSNNGSGEAFVFQNIADEYQLQATSSRLVTQDEGSENNLYGTEVGINCAGTLVIVGEPGADEHHGRADVYEREYEDAMAAANDEEVAQQSYIKSAVSKQKWRYIHSHNPDIEVTERGIDRGFGISLSMDGDGSTIAVGSTYHSLNVFELALTSMPS